MTSPYAVRHLSQSRKGRSWVTFARGDRHDATQGERRRLGREVGQGCGILRGDSPTTAAAVERHLQQDIEASPASFGGALQRRHDLGPIDGLDDVGVGGDVSHLVGLELADEVDGELVTTSQVSHLGTGLLILVLTNVSDTEVGEQIDITRREVLRHDDKFDLGGSPTGGLCRAIDAFVDRGEVGRQLFATPCHGTARTMTPAKRPVVPSRR